MNRIWQRISLGRDFSVISVADDVVRGGLFHYRGNRWHLKTFAAEKVDGNFPEQVAEVMKKLGNSDYCAVTGKVPEMLFFRFSSAALPVSAQRGAVEFELPRRLLKLPDAYQMQFVADDKAGADETVGVNVAVFPGAEINKIADKLEKAGCTADEFICPFMAVSPELPAIYLPEIEPDFYFCGSRWMPCPSEPEELQKIMSACENVIREAFVLPETAGFTLKEYMPLLLCAVLISRGMVHKAPEAFKVLPEKVRPVRYRKHLIISALLGVLLLADLGWYFCRTYGRDINEYRALTRELRLLKVQTQEMKSSSKRAAKEFKEMTRVVEMNVGKFDAVREFGLISEILPSNVMVSSMRWSDTDIDMVLQCENDKLDIPALIQPLGRWRISQLQQRQTGDSAVATINLKLAPLENENAVKKGAKK